MTNHRSRFISIAIDGPSGSGKSTLAKLISKKLGYIYIDTGSLYRSIGLYISSKGISKDDINNIIKSLEFSVINNANATIICTEARKKQITGSSPKILEVIHNTPGYATPTSDTVNATLI